MVRDRTTTTTTPTKLSTLWKSPCCFRADEKDGNCALASCLDFGEAASLHTDNTAQEKEEEVPNSLIIVACGATRMRSRRCGDNMPVARVFVLKAKTKHTKMTHEKFCIRKVLSCLFTQRNQSLKLFERVHLWSATFVMQPQPWSSIHQHTFDDPAATLEAEATACSPQIHSDNDTNDDDESCP